MTSVKRAFCNFAGNAKAGLLSYTLLTSKYGGAFLGAAAEYDTLLPANSDGIAAIRPKSSKSSL